VPSAGPRYAKGARIGFTVPPAIPAEKYFASETER
jgi:hypothetical protein